MKKYMLMLALPVLMLSACGGSQKSSAYQPSATIAATPVGPAFQADSAYLYCARQCDFGPRTMNSEAHERCGQWIAQQFAAYGLDVTEQRTTLHGYDGTPLLSNNIIASYKPQLTTRVMLCSHWDSRPWADNDPNPDNHSKPVMAANDGASGVAVMLELARLLTLPANQSTPPVEVGIDFICFDAEDWGVDGDSESWALGAQHWAAHPHKPGYTARFGVLLDMVGGQQARFCHEGYSLYYAQHVVDRVWRAASTAGYSSYFPNEEGGWVTDDHVPVNAVAGIPCIDIVPHYPNADASFGPTWHTVNDDMQHIDKNTLKAVGQTLVQLLWSL